MYKTDQEFENDLRLILKKATAFGTPYFKAYLGDRIFRILTIKGNPRSSHETWVVDFTLKEDNHLVVVRSERISWFMSESYDYQNETRANIFQEKVNNWISSRMNYIF